MSILKQKTVILKIKIQSNSSYEEFMQELAKEKLEQKRFLEVDAVQKIAKLKTGCLEHLIRWINSSKLLVAKECQNLFGDKVSPKQFA